MLVACSGTATAPTTVAPTSSTASPSSLSAEAVLAEALDAYAAGYEFSSEAIVGEQTAAVVDGRHIGGSAQMAITSGDGEVEYLVVGDTRWARSGPDELWTVVSQDQAPRSPLDALAAPTDVDVVSESGSGATLEAVYPAQVFGLSGPDLTVTLVIDSGRLVSASYATMHDGAEGAVTTTFRPLSDTTPITAPVE